MNNRNLLLEVILFSIVLIIILVQNLTSLGNFTFYIILEYTYLLFSRYNTLLVFCKNLVSLSDIILLVILTFIYFSPNYLVACIVSFSNKWISKWARVFALGYLTILH